jgi:hypothetical protein
MGAGGCSWRLSAADFFGPSDVVTSTRHWAVAASSGAGTVNSKGYDSHGTVSVVAPAEYRSVARRTVAGPAFSQT